MILKANAGLRMSDNALEFKDMNLDKLLDSADSVRKIKGVQSYSYKVAVRRFYEQGTATDRVSITVSTGDSPPIQLAGETYATQDGHAFVQSVEDEVNRLYDKRYEKNQTLVRFDKIGSRF